MGAPDVLARPIHVAVSPARRHRRVAPDSRVVGSLAGAAATHIRKLPRGIAAPVPLVHPGCAVLVEILRREEVQWQRLKTVWSLPIPCRNLAVTADIGRRINRWKRFAN